MSNPLVKRSGLNRNSILTLLCFGFIYLSSISSIQATHIVGGNMTYKCLGNNAFEVTLTVRRDCELGSEDAPFDNPAALGVYDPDGNLMTQIGSNGLVYMPFVSSDTIQESIVYDCSFKGQPVCVHETTYKITIDLPFNDKPYIIAYQRCCRNGSLNNVVDPLETGATYYVEIKPDVISLCNSSPEFSKWSNIYVCVNEDYIFDHSGWDADGDSLVYKLAMPNTGATKASPIPKPPSGPPYDYVDLMPGFTESTFMGSNPISIDPSTGVLRAKPNIIGQYLVGIIVEEYRFGVHISTVKRDFEVNVRNCNGDAKASFNIGENACNSVTIDPTNTSNGGDQFAWNFNFPSSDPMFQSTEIAPNFEYPAPGLYTIQLSSTRSSDGCTSYYSKDVFVSDGSLTSSFGTQLFACNADEIEVSFVNNSNESISDFEIVDWLWTISANGEVIESKELNPIMGFPPGTALAVSLEVMSTSGCSASFEQAMEVGAAMSAEIGFSILSCNDRDNTLNISLSDDTEYADGATPSSYAWTVTMEDGSVITSEDQIFEFATAQNQEITVTLVTDLGNDCDGENTSTYSTNIADYFDFDLNFIGCGADENEVTIALNSEIDSLPGGALPQNITWTLVNGNDPATDFLGNIVTTEVNLDETIFFAINVEYNNGCIGTITETIEPEDLINTFVDFSVTSSGCGGGGSDITITDTSLSPEIIGAEVSAREWTITYGDDVLEENGGASITVPNVMATTLNADLRLTLDNGCIFNINKDVALDSINTMGSDIELNFVSNPIVVCEGTASPIILNPNSDYTYTWSTEEGLTFEDPNDKSNPTVSSIEPRSYSVTVSDGVCDISGSVEVIPADQVELSVTGNIGLCSGGVIVTGVGVESGFFEWSDVESFETIFSAGPTLEIDFIEGPRTYYVRQRYENGCETAIFPFQVEAGSFSVDFVSTPIVTCDGQSTPIILNPNSEFQYEWSSEEGLTFEDPSDKSNPSVAPGITMTYMVTVTATDGCESIGSVNVLPAEDFTPIILGQDKLCNGDFELYVIPSSDESIIEWARNGSFNPIFTEGDTIRGQLEFPREVLYARERFPNGCVSDFDFYALEDAALVVDFLEDPVSACGQVGTYLVVGGKEDFTYTWEPTEGLDFRNGMFNPIATPNVPTTYFVTVMDGLCTGMDSIFVDVSDTIMIRITGSETDVCDDEITLESSYGDLLAVEWALTSAFDSIISRNSILERSQKEVEQTYFVRPTDEFDNCPAEVTSYTITNRGIALSDNVETYICPGDTLNFEFISRDTTQVLDITWNPDPHIISTDLNSTSITIISMEGEDTFELTYTATNQYGCGQEVGVIVFTSTPLDLSDVIVVTPQCGSFEVCFDAPVTDGSIAWNFGDDSTEDDMSTRNAPCYVYPSSGTYTVTYRNNDDAGCTFVEDALVIDVIDIGGVSLAQDTTLSLCELDTLTISAITEDDGSNITWFGSDGEQLSTGLSVDVIDASNSPITVIYDDGTCRDSASVELIEGIPPLEFVIPSTVCPGDTISVSVINNSADSLLYSWEPEECIHGNSDTSSVVLWLQETKEITLIVNNPRTECTEQISMDVTVSEFGLILDALPDTMINAGDEVTVSVFSERDDLEYEWSNGETGTDFTDTPTDSITYVLLASDSLGCQQMDQITISVSDPQCDETDVYIPSAFSPNGDDVNDELLVKSNFIETMEFTVYDRWGNQIFITTDQDTGWNGTHKNTGAELSPDVYAYCLKATCSNDVEYIISGNVSLLR